ncbi:MAG TPA: DNA polymerase/3'-5' exonuclease PolX [Vicinamibacterales bacterium]|nr:DNA polymerase/3'-5' exonuclease PolX [Vicinamibacterales bacterium]
MGLDNTAVARVLGQIADLLELKGENPFKIRAYRNAADVVGHAAEQVRDMDAAALRAWAGIGKDLALRILEIAATGDCAIRQELLQQYPVTLLDVMTLQGLGPKTAGRLFTELGVCSLTELEAAAKAGRIRVMRGMGAKKETLILKALEERQQHSGRHLVADAARAVDALVEWLRERMPALDIVAVGSLRRGAETCGDVDLLAVGAPPEVLEFFVAHPLVERVLGRGDTKASVLLRGGLQADLRAVQSHERGAALQYFTGSKAHNIVLRDRALERGWRLNEYGLFQASDESRIAGETEEGIYAALGMAYVPPELRENRGEIEAAIERRLPALFEPGQLRGDLHMHTTETDGRDTLEVMAAAAKARGLEYIAITDHSQNLAMANGMNEERTLAHADRVRRMNGRGNGLALLAGIECDILLDGRMDLADDCLAALDLVIASVHSGLSQSDEEMTTRLIKAIEHPHVDVIGHPTNRMLLRRPPSKVHIEKVIDAAAANAVALEINSNPNRLDLSDSHARLARERGVKLLISSDAHSTSELAFPQWGALVARRAWANRDDILNAQPLAVFRKSIKRGR